MKNKKVCLNCNNYAYNIDQLDENQLCEKCFREQCKDPELTLYIDLSYWKKQYQKTPSYIVCKRGEGIIDLFEDIKELHKKFPNIKRWRDKVVGHTGHIESREKIWARYLHYTHMDFNNITLTDIYVKHIEFANKINNMLTIKENND